MGPPRSARPRLPLDVTIEQWLEKIETNGVLQGMVIHVFNYNHDERLLTFSHVDVTAAEICEEIANIEQVKDDSRDVFSLWIIGEGLELQFRPTDDVFELARKFPRYVQKYLHSSQQTCSWRLYYKREACVSLARERKIKDPVSVRLLYFECAFNVLDSRYPIKEDDLFALAGMRMQILHGDYRADIHKIGFLTQPTNERLLDLIPSQMVQRATPTVGISFGVQRAPRFNDWEDRIYREHAKHKGKPRMIMHLLYLQLVRTYAFYGSTFFSACTQEPPQGHFEYRDRTLQLGVNAEGVYVIDPAKAAVLASHNYDDINWDVQQDSLVLEYGPTNAPLMMVLISPQARMAASIIAHAIKLLDERDAQQNAIRAEQAAQRAKEEAQRTPQIIPMAY